MITNWLTKEIFGELVLATRPEVVLVPSSMQEYFLENGMGTMKGVEFDPRVKNIKFLTKFVRTHGEGSGINQELDSLITNHKIPKFAFQIVDMAPDDTVQEVKDYLYETWRADQGPTANEFLKSFKEDIRREQEAKASKESARQEAGKEWRKHGGDPREMEFSNDVDALFDKHGNMAPVTCKIKTKSGKQMQLSIRIVDGELAMKMLDELTQKYGADFVKDHVKILSGKELKQYLEDYFGEEIESMEIAGGELNIEQFINAPKIDKKRLDDKMQDIVNQFKEKVQESPDAGKKGFVETKGSFHTGDEDLQELVKKLSNLN